MTVAIAIDTLAYARKLREAGFSEQQAEGQAEALAAAMTDTLATKQDLREVEARIVELEKRMDVRFDELDKRIELRLAERDHLLDAKLSDLERRMTIRLGGMMAAGFTILAAAFTILTATIKSA